VDGGFAARALARYAAIHSAERPPSYGGLALLPAAFEFLPLLEIRKQKQLRENERSGFSPARGTASSLGPKRQVTLSPAPAGAGASAVIWGCSGSRARLRSPLAVGMLINEGLDHRRDLLLLRPREF
jgi:hypothetical protein